MFRDNGRCKNHFFRLEVAAISLFVMAGLFMLPGTSQAQESWRPGQDTWKFSLGGYFPSISSDLKIAVNDSNINVEDDLGLSENDALIRLDGYWRSFRRHRLKFGYYGFDRDSTHFLSTDFTIDGQTWYADSLIKTEWKMDFYTIKYMYSFYQDDRWEIAGTLGAYWVRLKAALELALDFDNGIDPPLLAGDRFETETFEGPLPLLGLSFDYYITPRWLVTLQGGYFQLSVNEYDGKILNLGVNLEYEFTKMFGVGLGYDTFRLNVEAADKGSFAEVDYEYHGLQVYGILKF